MRAFWETALTSVQLHFTYRTAALAGLATNFFFGVLRAAVIVALYGAREQVEGITIAGAITFTGVSQASIAFLALFSWFDLMRSVYSGSIASDLLRPINFFVFWMAQDLGRALVNLLVRGLPIMAFYALVFGITVPRTGLQWSALLISLGFAWMISFSWRFLINLSSFWTPDAISIIRLGSALSWVFSGFLMPLRFFPPWVQELVYITPFPHMVNTVIEIYLGLLSPAEMAIALLWQAAWAVTLIAIGQLVLQAGVRRLVIQGG